jgi:hypothetical protein
VIRKPLWNRGGGVFVEETVWPQQRAGSAADQPADETAAPQGVNRHAERATLATEPLLAPEPDARPRRPGTPR